MKKPGTWVDSSLTVEITEGANFVAGDKTIFETL
jgi:hypothetical protein